MLSDDDMRKLNRALRTAMEVEVLPDPSAVIDERTLGRPKNAVTQELFEFRREWLVSNNRDGNR
jgi:hypothetical protein